MLLMMITHSLTVSPDEAFVESKSLFPILERGTCETSTLKIGNLGNAPNKSDPEQTEHMSERSTTIQIGNN